MFSKIKLYEQHYRELNEYRLAKAQEFVNDKGRLFFNLVPLMLHLNHSAVPCVISGDVPHGICNFKLNDIQRQVLEEYSQATGSPIDIITPEESILGLYCMGSTASVGQSPNSDFDYWVCVSEYMPDSRIRLLEKKCRNIKEMAASSEYRLDVNFFIVKTDKFKQNKLKNCETPEEKINTNTSVDEENCGTALHMFLLDEFYRSAICVAGKLLTWMIVPCSQEKDYSNFVKQLYKKRIISREEWLDLGCIGKIPSNEYFGAALWLMYKGTDSPFKAVIKILLMEIYSAEYPQTQLVSMVLKDKMHHGENCGMNLDSYYMVFEKISRFLRNHNDYERLELLRICFYLKISEGLSKVNHPNAVSERRTVINNMIEAWGWNSDTLSILNNRLNWNIVDIKKMYERVFNVLIQSYHALLTFGIDYKVTDAISYRDLSVLSRKLFVVFDSYPGKIKRYCLNSKINIAEKYITLVEVSDSSVLREGWYVYNCDMSIRENVIVQPILFCQSLATTVATCYFNNVINEKTIIKVFTKNSNITVERIKVIFNEIKNNFKNYPIKVSNSDLLKVTSVKNMLVMVNPVKDPTVNHRFVANSGKSGSSAFSYGPGKDCLIGSIDLIITNSWNEVVCNSYSGSMALFNFLNELGHYIVPGADAPECIQIVDFSAHMGDIMIKPEIEKLVSSCISNLSKKLLTSKMLTIGGNDYILQFSSRCMSITPAYGKDDLNPIKAEIMRGANSGKDKVPSIVEANCMYGMIQYFFVKNSDNTYQIYNSLENQDLKIYDDFKASLSDLILDITTYYTHSQSKFSKGADGSIHKFRQYFNIPQFFLVDIQNNTISPL